MAKPFDREKFSKANRVLQGFNLPNEAAVNDLRSNSKALRALLRSVLKTRDYLSDLERNLDAILVPDHIFDMANPVTVSELIGYKLEQQAKERLADIRPFYGSGVYIFYYHGDLPVYDAITGTNCPIYVGSAKPRIHDAGMAKQQGTRLFDRIMHHLRRSIKPSRNLNHEDFYARYLVVQSGLEKAAEDFLIRRYLPAWNKEANVCSGIGKHGDVARQELSDWDIMHGDRQWALAQTSRTKKTERIVSGNIKSFFRKQLADEPAKWTSLFNPDWVAKQKI